MAEPLSILLALIGFVVVTSLMTNQVAFAGVVIAVSFFAIVVWLVFQKANEFKPYAEFIKRLKQECFNPENRLGFLILSGDMHTQERVRGKIEGFTTLVNHSLPDDSDWKRLYIFLYEPRARGLDFFTSFVRNLPILSDFLKKQSFFACTKGQLGSNNLVSGNLIIKGTSVTTVGCLEMLNTYDLDKDVHLSNIEKDVERITLESFFDDLSDIVGEATKSDSSHEKLKELLNDKNKMDMYSIKK